MFDLYIFFILFLSKLLAGSCDFFTILIWAHWHLDNRKIRIKPVWSSLVLTQFCLNLFCITGIDFFDRNWLQPVSNYAFFLVHLTVIAMYQLVSKGKQLQHKSIHPLHHHSHQNNDNNLKGSITKWGYGHYQTYGSYEMHISWLYLHQPG